MAHRQSLPRAWMPGPCLSRALPNARFGPARQASQPAGLGSPTILVTAFPGLLARLPQAPGLRPPSPPTGPAPGQAPSTVPSGPPGADPDPGPRLRRRGLRHWSTKPFHAWHLQDFNTTGLRATHGGNYPCLASPGLQQHWPASETHGKSSSAWHLQDFNNTGKALERHTGGTNPCLASPGLQQHWPASDTRGNPFPAWHLQDFNSASPRTTPGGNHCLPGISRTSTTRALERHTGGTITSSFPASPRLHQHCPTSDT